MAFSIRYAIPMNGPGCQASVESKLKTLTGVEKIEVNLPTQEVVIAGSVAPSTVVSSMQEIGRDAFVRGSGLPNSAAVAILETNDGKVRGLARIIEIAKGTSLFDISLDKDFQSDEVAVHEFGDISNPPQTLGKRLFSITGKFSEPKADYPTISAWSKHSDSPLADLIGRSVYASSGLTGIIARSAGLWENDKTVCTCSGKTVWDERKDFRTKSNGHM